MQNIEKNLSLVNQQIAQAAADYSREISDISLLAVSKRKPASDLRIAYECGQTDFGENFQQEALAKMKELADLDITWHFIGPVQSNKTKALAETFDWVHCIDRLKIAQRLSDQRPESMAPLNICIQVNIDLEAVEGKLGVKLGESTPDGRIYLKREEECLAACCGAPMMMVDHVYHENLTNDKVDEILDGLD